MSNVRELAYEPVAGFQSGKAAQIAVFFVAASGGRIDKLKLAKLQYLSEREYLARYGRPMVYDELYSLPHGPICSSSLNGIEGKLGAGHPEWGAVRANGAKDIHGAAHVDREMLDEVSDAEFDVINGVWKRFGGFTANELRGFTHQNANCPEYTEVDKARLPISYRDLLVSLGNADPDVAAKDVEEFRRHAIRFPL